MQPRGRSDGYPIVPAKNLDSSVAEDLVSGLLERE
jgi:hypothetical protein